MLVYQCFTWSGSSDTLVIGCSPDYWKSSSPTTAEGKRAIAMGKWAETEDVQGAYTSVVAGLSAAVRPSEHKEPAAAWRALVKSDESSSQIDNVWFRAL